MKQTWMTNTLYRVGDSVIIFNRVWLCHVEHKSNIFGSDLFDNRYWKRDEDNERALALIAESIIEASDEEILQLAHDHGVDVDALAHKVKAILSGRLEQSDRAPTNGH